MVIRKSLYGHPAAGRRWAETRDQFILTHFNETHDSWMYTCRRMLGEPCMFYIQRHHIHDVSKCHTTIMLIHTDDADMIGESEEMFDFICNACDKKWKIKVVDSDFMLGVKRELKDESGEFSVTLTMTAYIDGMVEAFKDELPDHVNTPFPEHDKGFITKSEKVSDDDVQLYLNKGYMRMCGLILWAARNCFPECSLGASFLCRVMSCPSKKAYMAGLHMIRWLGQNRLRGIKFTHDPHGYPVAFSDASNKPDPTDSCKQYGYCIMWQGGPVSYVSKKLSHIGHHSAHNEYMALAEAGMVTSTAY